MDEYGHTSSSGRPLTAYVGTLPALPGRTTLNRTTDKADQLMSRRNKTSPFGLVMAHLHALALAVSVPTNGPSREVPRGLLPDWRKTSLASATLCEDAAKCQGGILHFPAKFLKERRIKFFDMPPSRQGGSIYVCGLAHKTETPSFSGRGFNWLFPLQWLILGRAGKRETLLVLR